jgi:carbamoyltransferase
VPAITHVDKSARIQTVDESAGAFHELLREFHRRTGVPMVLNTSFNGPGEPIVETPADALRFFVGSSLDALYLEGRRIARR